MVRVCKLWLSSKLSQEDLPKVLGSAQVLVHAERGMYLLHSLALLLLLLCLLPRAFAVGTFLWPHALPLLLEVVVRWTYSMKELRSMPCSRRMNLVNTE